MFGEIISQASPFLGFAVATSITPGVNNIMLTSSGTHLGYYRALPHLFGIIFGFLLLMLAVAFGLGAAFNDFPVLHEVLRYAGSTYLLYLAWKIFNASNVSFDNGGEGVTFWNALTLQFLNPKVWAMAVTAMSAFTITGSGYTISVFVVSGVFCAVYFVCGSIWVGFGVTIGKLMSNKPKAYRAFNAVMALLLVGTSLMIVLGA